MTSNQLIPIWALAIAGVALIGVIVYMDDSDFDIMAIPILPMDNIIETSNITTVQEKASRPGLDTQTPPYFKTFPEELSWYVQFEPTLIIEESNCDKLVTKYRAGEFQDKVNYAFRILEVCEL